MYHPFSVAETTKTAWDIFKKNFVTIIVYSIASAFLLGILGIVVSFFIPQEEFNGKMAVSAIMIFIQTYTTLGLYKLIFTLIDSEYYEFEFKQILPPFKSIMSYLGVVFFIAFVVTTFHFFVSNPLDDYPNTQWAIEQVAVIIALYIALRIMFFVTFIIDDQSGGFEAIKQSFQLTKGYFFKVFLMLLIILLLIALPAGLSQYEGLGFISIAIVFTYPFVNILLAVTYRKLIYSHQDVDDDIAETN